MTIFELLEKLETEIIALRTRFEKIEGSLAHSSSNGLAGHERSTAKRSVSRKKRAARKSASKPKTTKKVSLSRTESQQLELPVPEQIAPGEQQERVLGKRQALGRSLVQLRKMSAWRTHKPSEE